MMFKRGTKGWAGLNGRKPRNRNNKDAYSPSRRNQSNNNSSPSTTLKSKTECFFDDDDLPNLRYSTTTVKKKMPKLPVKKKTPLNCTRVSTLANFDEREAERERIRSLYFGEGESEITDIFNPWVIAHGRQQVKVAFPPFLFFSIDGLNATSHCINVNYRNEWSPVTKGSQK